MGVAAPLSLAATGLSAGSKIFSGFSASSADEASAAQAAMQQQNALGQAANALVQGQQTSEGLKFKAQSLSNDAEYGRTQAAQTDAILQQDRADKLSNLLVIRAATNTGSDSPTGAAISARTGAVADQDRTQKVGNIAAQVAQDQLGAAYYAKAGRDALAISRMQAKQYEANADAYGSMSATYASNASTDIFGGFLSGAGSLASGLAGLKLPTGF